MQITDPRITEYIYSLYRPLNPFLEQLRRQAEEQGIPIILRDTETLLVTLLQMKQPKRILEIGTAVAYSALCFAWTLPDAIITSIEISERMQEEAQKNIEAAGMQERIRVLPGDALSVLAELCQKREDPAEEVQPGFDFVFLDGAKGHYLEVWQLCTKLCAPGAVIVSDNILFKGMTASDEFLDTRRNRTIMNRMRDYLKEITEKPGVCTTVLPVGDGVAISTLTEEWR